MRRSGGGSCTPRRNLGGGGGKTGSAGLGTIGPWNSVAGETDFRAGLILAFFNFVDCPPSVFAPLFVEKTSSEGSDCIRAKDSPEPVTFLLPTHAVPINARSDGPSSSFECSGSGVLVLINARPASACVGACTSGMVNCMGTVTKPPSEVLFLRLPSPSSLKSEEKPRGRNSCGSPL